MIHYYIKLKANKKGHFLNFIDFQPLLCRIMLKYWWFYAFSRFIFVLFDLVPPPAYAIFSSSWCFLRGTSTSKTPIMTQTKTPIPIVRRQQMLILRTPDNRGACRGISKVWALNGHILNRYRWISLPLIVSAPHETICDFRSKTIWQKFIGYKIDIRQKIMGLALLRYDKIKRRIRAGFKTGPLPWRNHLNRPVCMMALT